MEVDGSSAPAPVPEQRPTVDAVDMSTAPAKKRRTGYKMRKIEPCPSDAAMVRGAFFLSLRCVCLTANSHLSCLR